MPRKTIREHIEHPDYPLEKLSSHREYICGGCNTPGTGSRYRCAACDFELHEYCSYCPNNLSSFMHPHDLILVTSDHLETLPSCDVCRETLTGFHYMCQLCQFDVHPLCTQLPEDLRHVADSHHPLKLRRLLSSAFCVVCRTACSPWCYGCDACGVNIHLQCLLQPYVSSTTASQPAACSSRGFGHNPGVGSGYYSYSGGAFSYGYGVPYYGYSYGYGVPYYGFTNGYYVNQQSVGGGSTSSSMGRSLAKSMFSLVGDLTSALISNVVLGSLGFPSF